MPLTQEWAAGEHCRGDSDHRRHDAGVALARPFCEIGRVNQRRICHASKTRVDVLLVPWKTQA